MKKPVIPAASNLEASVSALKINVDIITGRTAGEIKALASTAINKDLINKINEIISRINAST